MRYGRQRWKLRGRIEINGKQVWDSEEMVFVPLISEFLSVKVSTSCCFLTIFGNHFGSISIWAHMWSLKVILMSSLEKLTGVDPLKAEIFGIVIKLYSCGLLGDRAEELSQSRGCRKCFLRDEGPVCCTTTDGCRGY